ncbi:MULTISPECIES: hypothetical protein [unclassified Cytobacillus]|uniref:hypothetical protein n=1 Tax=unclassified Cytobacillus TaxID=2675268 RepID=UPI001358EFFF|nr:hypothetical protein [Cytobacillus sp. AMY 15.2]KAF0817649.1 hypothetical protein KIS4809_3466 [Bacillus sp. ZZV12-4809]MCM3092183.1 hypothetical protein [Cytobacillus sp. AMY 15.2]
MNISDRLTKLLYVKELDLILCADIKGRLHYLNKDLSVVKSSPSTHYNNMINAITFDNGYVFTKDIRGVIGKWDLATLKPLDFHDDYSLRSEEYLLTLDEEPSPSLSRGIGTFNGKLYTNNGYSQFVVLDQETFEPLDILPPFNEKSFIDCICTENESIQAISETCGILHLGTIDNLNFDKKVPIDSGNVHIIKYDQLHNRFVATQDYGLDADRNVRNGIVTINPDNLEKKEYHFTTDDVEFLLFSEDYKKIITGGFDGRLYIYDNTNEEIKLVDVIGPFRYQFVSATIIQNEIFLLMQSGELVKVDFSGKILSNAIFDYSCIWSIEQHPEDKQTLYLATGKGVSIINFESTKYNSVTVKKIKQNVHSLGITFRVCPLKAGSYLAVTRDNIVYKADMDGTIIWYKDFGDLTRYISINENFETALLGLENGDVYELDVSTGSTLNKLTFNAPIYVTGYRTNGNKIIGLKTGEIIQYNSSFEKLNAFTLDGYPKRIVQNEKKEFITGTFGFIEIDFDSGESKKVFTELLWNTNENGTKINDHVFVISYGKQIGAYDYATGDMVDLVEPLYDYPKGLYGVSLEGEEILFVGGNGGFVNIYRIVDGSPIKVREFYA